MKKFCELTLYHKVIAFLSILFRRCLVSDRLNRSLLKPRGVAGFCFPQL
jgi:hypothetical protein